jgi:hypothetical protein
MSMIAQFVQVTPEKLGKLLANPESINGLFHDPDDTFTGSLGQQFQQGAGRLKEAAAGGELAKQFAAALDVLGPGMKQMLEQHLSTLGMDVSGLQAGKGGESVLKLMQKRLGPLMPRQHVADEPTAINGRARNLSLEKAWHGVHYLLCGQVEPSASLLGQAVFGGKEFGEDLGYGPARYFSIDQTANISRELARPALEREMKRRFDPARMSSLSIYPGGWDHSGYDWLIGEFQRLRDFYADAAGSRNGVVTCIL